MSTEGKLTVTELQRFCMHDGPGIRTTVFLKGCPLSCAWCHNPETKKQASELLFYPQKCIGCGLCTTVCPAGVHRGESEHVLLRSACLSCFRCADDCPTGALERCGKEMTVEEIVSVSERDVAFYGSEGGITLSGGEPFLWGDQAVTLLKACKEHGLSTAVETSGYARKADLLAAAPYVDLFLYDIKDTDDERHRHYTGVSNELILENLHALNQANARIRLRCILINGVNTNGAHYESVAQLARQIGRLDGVEFLPYHAYGGSKATFLGNPDNGNVSWIPTAEQLEHAIAVFDRFGVRCICRKP